MLKILPVLMLGCLCLFLSACTQTEDHLTINADGSAEVVIRVLNTPNLKVFEERNLMPYSIQFTGHLSPAEFFYPPREEQAARGIFSDSSAEELVFGEESGEDGSKWFVTRARYRDITSLQRSEYAQIHNLHIQRLDGRVSVHATAMRTEAAFILNAMNISAGTPKMFRAHDPEKLMKDAALTFRVTLPAAVSAETAQIDGNTASFTASYAKDGKNFGVELMRPLSISCTDAGLSFVPADYVLPGMRELAFYKEGPVDVGTEVDDEALRAAAQIFPVSVRLQHHFDFTGNNSSGNSYTTIVACATFPAKFNVSDVSVHGISQALDDKGMSMRRDDRNRYYSSFGDELKNTDGRSRHIMQINLMPPQAGAKSISTLRGEYKVGISSPEIVVIRDFWPLQAQKENEFVNLESPALKNMNMSINIMGHASPARDSRGYEQVVMHMYRTSHDSGVNLRPKIMALGVYDAEGKVVPSYNSPQSRNDLRFSCGATKPLSLVLLLNGTGNTKPLILPFEFKDIPLMPPHDTPGGDDAKSGDE